jgi:hypothetical protein
MIGSTKTIATVSILGLLASTAGDTILAEAVGADMPWFAQFGLCGLFGALLWWKIAKSDIEVAKTASEAVKEAAKVHADALGEVKDELVGMRSDFNVNQASTQSLLKEALFPKRGGP